MGGANRQATESNRTQLTNHRVWATHSGSLRSGRRRSPFVPLVPSVPFPSVFPSHLRHPKSAVKNSASSFQFFSISEFQLFQ
jgi:hypothetical protein